MVKDNAVPGRKPHLTREQYAWVLERQRIRRAAGTLKGDAAVVGMTANSLAWVLRRGYKAYR